MAGNKLHLSLWLAAVLALAGAASAQTKGTVRHHREAVVESAVSPQVQQAEAAIEKRDFAVAEPLLTKAVADDPRDYRAWYDLGYVYGATGRKPEQIEAYRKAVAAKPDVFESNFALGLALLASGDSDGASFLRAATTLKPATAQPEKLALAWLALGQALQDSQPDQALEAFHQAATLQPKDAAPHLAAAELLQKRNNLAGAETEFRQAVELNPDLRPALAGLVKIYISSRRLPEAESVLRRFLAVNPDNVAAHLQLGRVLEAEGKNDEAADEFNAVLKSFPDDLDALRELAAMNVAAKKYGEAETQYRALLQKDPNDATLRHAFGSLLMQEHKFPEAQQELLTALKIKPDLADAYGDLAVAASETRNYPLVLRALDSRARYLPETPATYFLRATAYDNMKAYQEAAESYRQFLAAANGKYPDQEFQARHRLLAIDPKGQKKK